MSKPKDLYGRVVLAIRVNKILTVVNRRYIRAARAYNGGGADGRKAQADRWARMEWYANDSNRRERELLEFLPSKLSERDLYLVWSEANEGSAALSECCAEDASEAAIYGDGPCGSMARRHALHEVNELAKACYQENARRHPPEPVVLAPGEDPCPF